MSERIETEIGSLPVDWDYKPLEYFFEKITYGFTNPMPTTEKGPYMVTAKDVNNGKIQYETARKTSQEAFDTLLTPKSIPEINDVLITKDGSIGRVGIVDRTNLCINQSVAVIRPNERIRPLFLKYLLETPIYQKLIERDADGSTIKHIYITRINQMLVGVPKLSEQDGILGIIHNIQQKIDLLRQQNQDLEELAQTLFKRWFVEFEFPNENGEPYKSSGGVVIESELGEIPEGWKISHLQNIATLVSRGISPKYIEEGGICVLNQRCIRNKTIDFSIGRRHNNEIKNAQSKFIQPFDVLVNSTGVGTLGRTAVVKRIEEEPITVDSHVSIIRANEEKVNKYFLSCLITGKEREIEHMAEGSTGQTELSRAKLNEMEVLIPTEELQIKFGRIYFTNSQKISSNEKEIQTLTKLRDTLLPKLMSGELRVNMEP